MAARSQRLVDPQALSAAGAVVYTVPAGAVALVKGIRFINTTGATAALSLCVGTLVAGHALYWQLPVAAGRHIVDDEWMVLEAGDELRAASSVDGAITLTISGAVLHE